MSFVFFSVYLLGSGSIWTFLESWIRIRMKTYADPKHCFCDEQRGCCVGSLNISVMLSSTPAQTPSHCLPTGTCSVADPHLSVHFSIFLSYTRFCWSSYFSIFGNHIFPLHWNEFRCARVELTHLWPFCAYTFSLSSLDF